MPLITCNIITEHYITNNTAINVGFMILHNNKIIKVYDDQSLVSSQNIATKSSIPSVMKMRYLITKYRDESLDDLSFSTQVVTDNTFSCMLRAQHPIFFF